MTFSEYRKQFNSVEEFKRALGKRTEEEAHAMIASDNSSTTVKAAMLDTWRMARKENEE